MRTVAAALARLRKIHGETLKALINKALREGLKQMRDRPNYRLYVEFSDGVAGVVDLTHRLFGPMFEPLETPSVFAQVNIDEFGVISWPSGADLAPDALYETLRAKDRRQPSTMSSS